MSLFRRPWYEVACWFASMAIAILGAAAMLLHLLLYGTLHVGSGPECMNEVSTSALASIEVKSLDTPKEGVC